MRVFRISLSPGAIPLLAISLRDIYNDDLMSHLNHV
jgi:hypothetical protein